MQTSGIMAIEELSLLASLK